MAARFRRGPPGIEYTYVCYPRQIMNMEFSESNGNQLEARTKEGLNLGLDVSIEWRLKGDQIYELFEALNQNYVRLFESLALDSVRTAAGQYPALSYLSSTRYALQSGQHACSPFPHTPCAAAPTSPSPCWMR